MLVPYGYGSKFNTRELQALVLPLATAAYFGVPNFEKRPYGQYSPPINMEPDRWVLLMLNPCRLATSQAWGLV